MIFSSVIFTARKPGSGLQLLTKNKDHPGGMILAQVRFDFAYRLIFSAEIVATVDELPNRPESLSVPLTLP